MHISVTRKKSGIFREFCGDGVPSKARENFWRSQGCGYIQSVIGTVDEISAVGIMNVTYSEKDT